MEYILEYDSTKKSKSKSNLRESYIKRYMSANPERHFFLMDHNLVICGPINLVEAGKYSAKLFDKCRQAVRRRKDTPIINMRPPTPARLTVKVLGPGQKPDATKYKQVQLKDTLPAFTVTQVPLKDTLPAFMETRTKKPKVEILETIRITEVIDLLSSSDDNDDTRRSRHTTR